METLSGSRPSGDSIETSLFGALTGARLSTTVSRAAEAAATTLGEATGGRPESAAAGAPLSLAPQQTPTQTSMATLAALGQQLTGATRHLHASELLAEQSSDGQTAPLADHNSNHHNHHHHHHHLSRASDGAKLQQSSDTTIATAMQHLDGQAAQAGDYFSVNLNSIKVFVSQNMFELILICVIVIYLVYYFSKISRRPKLLGHRQSPFVRFIESHFEATLKSRFSPLIYFWGTNPQTALFGYLQGQTSNDEMPRNKFKRQYLYVSDLQYLASNVDLNKYYESLNAKSAKSSNKKQQNHKLIQLDASKLMQTAGSNKSSRATAEGLVYEKNIRLALDQMARQFACNNNNSDETNQNNGNTRGGGEGISATTNCAEQRILAHPNKCHSSENTIERPKSLSNDGSDSTASSSSDSGVFANGSLTASSVSSSSSSTSLAIDMSSVQCNEQKCSCAALYDSNLNQFEAFESQQQQPVAPADAAAAAAAASEPKSEQFEFGQCALDWYRESHKNYHENKLIALISAGMTTGSDKKYVTDTVQTLEKLGYEVCVFIRRGVGGLRLSSSRFFSPSKWRDFEAAILSIRKQRPDARLVAIGFSFGSIELCRYLSMSGSASLVSAALLISCPFDPEAGGRNMRKRALNRRIDAYLAKNLGKQLHQALTINENCNSSSNSPSSNSSSSSSSASVNLNDAHKFYNHNGSLVDLNKLPKIKSLVDFEDNYNRVIQNYPNSEAYAADSRLHDYLDNIKTPTLCLSSEDDFMAPTRLLPIKQIQANKNLCMLLTKRGGHMAFVDGLVWPKRPYFAQRIIGKYMAAIKVQLEVVAQNERPRFAEQRKGLAKRGGDDVATSRRGSITCPQDGIKQSARNLLNMLEERPPANIKSSG